MKSSNVDERIRTFIDEIESTELYAVVCAKSDIAVLIHNQMEARSVSCAELSRRLGKSRAYISKMLGGGTNMTIETLVGIARVLDCHFSDFIPRPKEAAATIAAPRVNELSPDDVPNYASRPNLRCVDDNWPASWQRTSRYAETRVPCDDAVTLKVA